MWWAVLIFTVVALGAFAVIAYPFLARRRALPPEVAERVRAVRRRRAEIYSRLTGGDEGGGGADAAALKREAADLLAEEERLRRGDGVDQG